MTIESKFIEFVRQNGRQAFSRISQFFNEEKEHFYALKKAEYLAEGYRVSRKIERFYKNRVGVGKEALT